MGNSTDMILPPSPRRRGDGGEVSIGNFSLNFSLFSPERLGKSASVLVSLIKERGAKSQ